MACNDDDASLAGRMGRRTARLGSDGGRNETRRAKPHGRSYARAGVSRTCACTPRARRKHDRVEVTTAAEGFRAKRTRQKEENTALRTGRQRGNRENESSRGGAWRSYAARGRRRRSGRRRRGRRTQKMQTTETSSSVTLRAPGDADDVEEDVRNDGEEDRVRRWRIRASAPRPWRNRGEEFGVLAAREGEEQARSCAEGMCALNSSGFGATWPSPGQVERGHAIGVRRSAHVRTAREEEESSATDMWGRIEQKGVPLRARWAAGGGPVREGKERRDGPGGRRSPLAGRTLPLNK